ncbi:hypothetical protein L1987_25803 [Smallanthus sonchifolius]|uniref:Uncharacterized protein n=1 Tax=Smallanthus sonchifolius TaxID=185202 RepID=A0ACB9I7Z0_9ASTR|nr:hypothetical protein L1987_25803 [Smallanthus sonchifolius]
MSTVWGSQNSRDKCAITHCRLNTALIRTQWVIDEDSQYTFKVHRFFSVKGLHDMENWKYTLTERKHILKDRKTGQVLFGVREDVPSLQRILWKRKMILKRAIPDVVGPNARSNEIQNRRMTKLEEDQERHALAVQWVPPPPLEPSGSGSSDAFDFHGTLQDVEDMFKEYFGEQVKSQPYDHHYNPNDYQPPGSGTH